MGQKKKQKPPEYRLHVFHHTDPDSGARSVVFLFLTVKEFANFNYEILLEADRQNHSLTLRILGIHAPRGIMPGWGPARGYRKFTDLQGHCMVTVRKSAKDSAELEIDVRPDSIVLLRTSSAPFLSVSTEPPPLWGEGHPIAP